MHTHAINAESNKWIFIIIIIDSFHIALFSALEQITAHMSHVILNEWLYEWTFIKEALRFRKTRRPEH